MINEDEAGTTGMEIPGVKPEESKEGAVLINTERAVEAMKRRIGDLQERAESIRNENTKESILELQIINSEIAEIEETVKNIRSGKIVLREKNSHIFIPSKIPDDLSRYSLNPCVVCGIFEGEEWDEIKRPCQY